MNAIVMLSQKLYQTLTTTECLHLYLCIYLCITHINTEEQQLSYIKLLT
jgi:hypothetical protein